MTIFEYDVTTILPIEEKWMRCFVKGLQTQLRIETQSLVTMGRSFLDIVNHTYTIKQLCHEAQGGKDKRDLYEGSYNGGRSNFRIQHDRSPLRFQQGQSSQSIQAHCRPMRIAARPRILSDKVFLLILAREGQWTETQWLQRRPSFFKQLARDPKPLIQIPLVVEIDVGMSKLCQDAASVGYQVIGLDSILCGVRDAWLLKQVHQSCYRQLEAKIDIRATGVTNQAPKMISLVPKTTCQIVKAIERVARASSMVRASFMQLQSGHRPRHLTMLSQV